MPISFRTIEELRRSIPSDMVVDAPTSKLWEDYLRLKSFKKVAKLYGVSAQTVCNRFKESGYSVKDTDFCTGWTDEEICILKQWYSGDKTGEELNLDELSSKLGRHKSLICRKARSLGLTDQHREKVRTKKGPRQPKFKTQEELSKFQSERSKRQIAENGHPRGALGMKHSDEAKTKISEGNKQWWALLTEEEKSEFILKRQKSSRENGNTTNPRGKWKSGWRIVGDREVFFRSRWEANYARLLQWMKINGHIKEWYHEVETFWFHGIRRGCVSYLPDFKVVYKDETIEYHEVKGWMDDRSKTALSRMAKYYPDIKVVLVDKIYYEKVRNTFAKILDEWEEPTR